MECLFQSEYKSGLKRKRIIQLLIHATKPFSGLIYKEICMTSQTVERKLERSIGLPGGVALVIGGVIGMGIYALIAAVAAQVGSALWLAFLIAIVVSIIGVLPIIQISSALPRAGAGYLYTSRLLNPYLGSLTSYFAILGGASSTAMVALGVAQYITPYLPVQLPELVVAIALPILFFFLYIFGLRLAASLQVILALHLVVALIVYGIAGTVQLGIELSFSLPQGGGGLIMATILSYSVCMGFQVIAEMGEEMHNARKNIPLSLLIGGSIVLVIYILVGSVFVKSIPYDFETIKLMKAPLMETGTLFLPAWFVLILSAGALSAGLTSFNAGAIALPRELYSQARDRLVPPVFGRVHKSGSPLNAVGAYFLFVILLLLLRRSIDFYGVMTAVGILFMTVLLAIAAVNLPGRFPDQYATAYVKLSRTTLIIVTIVAIVSSLGFMFIVLTELPVVALIYLICCLLVTVYYRLRVRWLQQQGFDFREQMKTMPGSDERIALGFE